MQQPDDPSFTIPDFVPTATGAVSKAFWVAVNNAQINAKLVSQVLAADGRVDMAKVVVENAKVWAAIAQALAMAGASTFE